MQDYHRARVRETEANESQSHHCVLYGSSRNLRKRNTHTNPNRASNNNIDSIKMNLDWVSNALSVTHYKVLNSIIYMILT